MWTMRPVFVSWLKCSLARQWPAAYAIDDVMQMSFPDAISVISHAVALWEFFFVVVAVLTIGPFYDILL